MYFSWLEQEVVSSRPRKSLAHFSVSKLGTFLLKWGFLDYCHVLPTGRSTVLRSSSLERLERCDLFGNRD